MARGLRGFGLAVCTAVSASAALSFTSPPDRPLSVLTIYELDASLPAAVELARGFDAALSRHAPPHREIYSEYLDLPRFRSPEHLGELAEFLARKYRDIAFDVVVVAGPGALRFTLDHRPALAPEAPLVFGGVRADGMEELDLPDDVSGVTGTFDLRRTVDLAIRLQPNAQRIVVLSGSAPFDRSWEQTAREELGDRVDGLPVSFLSGLTIDGFAERVQALDRRTILVVLTVFADAAGRQGRPHEVAARLAQHSSAPAYSVYSTYMGRGFVGGYVDSFETMGETMAELSMQAVEGELSGSRIVAAEGRDVVDWRQLQRFGISERLVPSGAQLLSYDPTLWQRYRPEILLVLTVMMIQTSTIVALVRAERKRRLIARQLADGQMELAHLSRTAQLGMLSGALAHELNQPLTSILANAEAGSRLIEAGPESLDEIAEILADIALDDRRAANIIAHMRRLLVKGETELELIDVSAVVASALAIARSEFVVRRTHVEVRSSGPGVMVLGNLPQLQQILLNLMLNAMDAMEELPVTDRKIVVETGTREDGWWELAVEDSGPGVSAEIRAAAFKPFVSTKSNGLGFGLSICRSIARAHRGTLDFDETVATGARVVLALPPPSEIGAGNERNGEDDLSYR